MILMITVSGVTPIVVAVSALKRSKAGRVKGPTGMPVLKSHVPRKTMPLVTNGLTTTESARNVQQRSVAVPVIQI